MTASDESSRRRCVRCNSDFDPWSVGPSRLPKATKGDFLEPVVAPTRYECLGCRSAVPA